METNLYTLLILSLSAIFSVFGNVSSSVIWNEVLTKEELSKRVKDFNTWYKKLNPEATKVEARLTPEGEIGSFALEDIQAGDSYLNLKREMTINAELIYQGKYSKLINELEEKFGYDDNVNMIIYLLTEMSNPDSKWKPYLDLLPRQPRSIAYNYWNFSSTIEPEMEGMTIMRKIVDYKLNVEKRTNQYLEMVFAPYPDLFDKEFFNEENIEWAIFTLDSRTIYLELEAFLVPMLDLFTIGENPKNPSKTFKGNMNNKNVSLSYAVADFFSGDRIYENIGWKNDDLVVYMGRFLEENFHDCYSWSALFTERKEDKLVFLRKDFYKRYFLFDRTQIDLIEECISFKNPFVPRMMFYFYTLMMDESELKQPDPKRTELENDRIILEYVKNNFKSKYELMPFKVEHDMAKLKTITDPHLRLILGYKIEQKKYLVRLIEYYNNEYHKLLKEDSL